MINKFDVSIAIVVTYIDQDQKDLKSSALGWYTSNLLENINPAFNKKLVVLSNIQDKKKIFEKNGILVDECWHKGKLSFWMEIIQVIQKYPGLGIIHFQHEFNQFGDLLSVPLSLILAFYIKIILRKKIVSTLHGVISQKIINKDFSKINNLPLPTFLLKVFFGTFYRITGFLANSFIVHESYFRDILIKEYHYNKPIGVIPIGIDDKEISLTKNTARKKIGIDPKKKVVMFFGFLAGYKGIDLLVDAFNKIKDDSYYLIIAGGKPKRVEKDKKYSSWFNALEQKCKQNTNILMTGFVSDADLEKYFISANLIVLPYLFSLSASGPITLATAYKIPFIASNSFKGIIDDRFLFEKNTTSLKNKIVDFFAQGDQPDLEYINYLKKSRSWRISADKTIQIYKSLGGI